MDLRCNQNFEPFSVVPSINNDNFWNKHSYIVSYKTSWFYDGDVFTTLHFLYKLQIGPISLSVCPWKPSLAKCDVILHHIGPIRKWSVVNTIPREEVEILTLLPFLTRESRQVTFVDVCGRICKTFGRLKCIWKYKKETPTGWESLVQFTSSLG